MAYELDLVPVRFYDDPMEAHLARCLLENEGIRAFVHDENIVGLNRMLSYAIGQVKLKVQGSDRTKALQILEELEHRPYLDEQQHAKACSNCKSTDLTMDIRQPRSPGAILHFILAAAFSVLPLSMDRSARCNRCGHIFPAEPGD